MTVTRKVVACLLVCLVLAASWPATAQDPPKSFKPEELDQIVAPIALHPDPLLAQVLMASTYPLEVVQAARFVKDNASLKGDQLNEALKQQSWDDSVKSLTTFPQVLTMMSDKLDWLQKLGDAFLEQQAELMAAVQRLRARAEAEGQLKSTSQQQVIVEAAPPPTTTTVIVQAPPTVIKIEPVNPQVVYVPSYNPVVVYGAWPYPAYPPYSPYPPGYFAAGVFTFAAGVAVGSALWGNCNWGGGGGDVNVNVSQHNSFTNNVNNVDSARKRAEHYSGGGGSGTGGQNRGKWQHNPEHRKGVQYRDTATQQRFNKTGPANAQARESFRGRTAQQTGGGRASAQQGALGQQGGRDGLGQGGGAGRGPQASTRPSGIGQGGAGQTRQAGAFEGMGSGRETGSYSNRGNASRDSFKQSSGAARSGGGAAAGTRGGGGGSSSRGGGGGGGARGGGGRR